MKSKPPNKKAASRFDKPFETVEIEHLDCNGKEADERICALMHALLEIDQILSKEETAKVYQEAS